MFTDTWIVQIFWIFFGIPQCYEVKKKYKMNFLKKVSKSIKKQLTQPLCDDSEEETGVLSFYQFYELL